MKTKTTFANAIAYLVRRFDENTAEENFLRHSFGLSIEDSAWEVLVKSFDLSVEAIENLPLTPYRTQDRLNETIESVKDVAEYEFSNESDTDFALETNRIWAQTIVDKWSNIHKVGGYNVHSVIDGNSPIESFSSRLDFAKF